ncbi:alpha-glucosidase C-terminal domain-containing protein, partial [Staphylococcus arlettae]
AIVYFLQQGTPFIYQGQEIGMTNYPFEHIETFNDVAVINEYNIVKAQGGDTEALLHKHKMENRDNGRTPMQWNTDKHAGFSTAEPWFPVNPNYKDINVAQQLEDPDSILNFYKDLIKVKKSDDVFTYGQFDLVDENNSQVFAYTRKLNDITYLIVGNLTDKNAQLSLDNNSNKPQTILHNYDGDIDLQNLRPFEAAVIKL